MSDNTNSNNPTAEQETLLEFPCEFQVKAMGHASETFEQLIISIVSNHVDALPDQCAKSRPSSNGKYVSVSVSITATSKVQLDNIYIELSAHESVLMAL